MRFGWQSGTSRSACERHGIALFDLVDGGIAGSETDAALEHIATCDRCRDEAADAALLVVWLGRLATAEAGATGPGAGEAGRAASRRRTWNRILGRLEGPRGPATAGRMAGLLTVPLLVLALAGPRLLASPACEAPAGDLAVAAGVAECQDALPAPTFAPSPPGIPTQNPVTLLTDASGATLVVPAERFVSRVPREPEEAIAASPAPTGIPPRVAEPPRSGLVPRSAGALPI